MGLVAGLVPAAVAAVAFGVQYVPVKKYKHLGFETRWGVEPKIGGFYPPQIMNGILIGLEALFSPSILGGKTTLFLETPKLRTS